MTALQMALDITPSSGDLYPRVESLHKGDLLEGYDDKAFPRPLRVLGINITDDGVEVIYRERVGTDVRYGSLVLPAGTNVDIKPPF